MKQRYTTNSKSQPRKNYTLTSVMSPTQRGVTLIWLEASRLTIQGVAPFCWPEVRFMNEYKFIDFNDDKKGRRDLQETIDKLSADGWKIDKTETINGGWNILKTILLGILFLPLALFGKRKRQIKIVLSRQKEEAK